MDGAMVVGIVSAVLGGGVGSTLTVIMQGKSAARKIDAEASAIGAKTPAEVDSIALQGAESAVRVLQQSNQTLVADNERLFNENTRLRGRVEQMEATLEQVRQRAEVAERGMAEALDQLRLVKESYEELATQIRTFRRDAAAQP